MKLRTALVVTVVAVIAAPWTHTVASAGSARATAAWRGAAWLASRQENSGSFGADRADLVAETLAAMVAGGTGGKTAAKGLRYIEVHGEDDATQAPFTGRIIAGIVAAGGDPTDHGGVDYTEILASQYDASTGEYQTDDDQLFPNLLAANGALAAHGDLPPMAVEHIVSNACPSGGFGFRYGCPQGPDVDTTAWAINVLAAAGEGSRTVVKQARSYLLDTQRSDGGWGFAEGIKTGSDSTGLALAAIEALGEDAQKAPWRQGDGDDPVRKLLRLQRSSGAFVNTASKADVTSTTNVVPGLARLAYPITGPGTASKPKPQPGATRAPSGRPDPSDEGAGSPNEDPEEAASSSRPGDGDADAEDGGSTPSSSGAPEDGRRRTRDEAASAESFDRPAVAEEDEGPSLLGNPLLWLGAALAGGGAGFFGLRFLRR